MAQSQKFLVSVFLLLIVQISSTGSESVRYDIGGRIINGTLATTAATKHQVSLRQRLQDSYFFGTGHICGGSLIRRNIVLTAGHCLVDQYIYDGTFVKAEDLIVVMGTLNRFEQNGNTLILNIKKMVMPLQKFDLSTYDKDVALLFLDGAVPENHPTIAPIVMVDAEVPAGTVCQVTGWGQTEEGWTSDFLMTVDVPIIDHEVCVNDTQFSEELILKGMMCAGYLEGERDACAGDSGGPLVCYKKLGGIVSWGSGCALPRLPGVYTDVAYWREWIDFEIYAYESTENSGDGSGEGSGDIGSGNVGSGEGSGDIGSGEGSGDIGSGEGSGEGSGDIGSGEGSGEGSGSGDGNAALSLQSSFALICFFLTTAMLMN